MEETRNGYVRVEDENMQEVSQGQKDMVLTTSGSEDAKNANVETFLSPIEEEQKMQELTQDFKSFVQNLPRKLKRKVYSEKKFGNVLEVEQRRRRLAKLTSKK